MSDTLKETPGLAARGWLETYPANPGAGDLYRGAKPDVARKWEQAALFLAEMGAGDPAAVHEQVARQIADLGLTFRIAGDEDERTWPLTAMPVIIGADEWNGVEQGLIQRARLLESLAQDIYGPQNLIANGDLPAAVVAGSPYFTPRMVGQGPRAGSLIHVYAADLARGPGGEWRVLQDRVRLATGVGYALENRLAMSRMTESMLGRINVRRLARFFSTLRAGMAGDCQRENPRLALLTPGRFNQTYPEQAHLARYLGLPLVEGRDLVVQEDRLYVRTIAGPRRIDGVWRWINTNALDPLTFDNTSELGVPNLFEAWTRGGVEIANRPGVEVLESRAFSAFMPRLCRTLLGEEPILPTIATWWCGQADEARTVRDRLDGLAIVSAFGEPVEGLDAPGPMAGNSLSASGRDALLDAMRRRPMDYCGQEIVHLSTTPAIIGDALVPRPFTVRAFVARSADGEWVVMPGGFARLSSQDAMPTNMIGEGDLSADVCIVDETVINDPQTGVLSRPQPVRRGSAILASQAADNLFWFGRYNERAEAIVRVVRSILGSSIEADAGSLRDVDVRRSLSRLLVEWNTIAPEMADAPFPHLCATALEETELAGGVGTLVQRAQSVGLALRERFARDFWRLVIRPVPTVGTQRPQGLLSLAKGLIERFGALSGLAGENMVRGPAWRFLEMGGRLERAIATCRFTRLLLGQAAQSDALGVLLDLTDSQIVYRTRYFAGHHVAPTLDLVLLDPENPRSLLFQVAEIAGHLAALPSLREDTVPEEPLRQVRALLGRVQSLDAAQIDDALLAEIEQALFALSESLTTRYFLRSDRADPTQDDRLLG